MAEGLLRTMFSERYHAFSAGVFATAVYPRAVQAMQEIGIDTSFQRFKAREVMHRSFADPAAVLGSEEEQLWAFRSARDEIREWVSATFGRA